ncbi:chaperone required for assembly of F1-ATPase [Stella humosa]|uniref:Chaperone required for assembly of F1-ATPase n=1 Tax=Stella humosa TaxID=94 RepID=A0A3N1MBT8_9PROT|nr:ATP12 family protein [Stella humosa]ROQ00515.1 chaperone required for assembly of F1-ATPase [Stella humosa]BBK30241.1 ATPase [Stella humosa]
MRRVYKLVAVTAEADGHQVRLDGRPLRTPGRQALLLPHAALAAAIAGEWDAQTDKVRPATMPMTQLAATAIDRVLPDPAAMADAIARFGASDLLCYRAQEPAALVQRQHAVWQPLLDWAALEHDAALHVAHGVMPVDQPPAALAALRAAVGRIDPWRLAALSVLTPAAGSLVIALAVVLGRLDAETAWAASQLDETFQIEAWGEDAEAAERRRALLAEMAEVERFIALLG